MGAGPGCCSLLQTKAPLLASLGRPARCLRSRGARPPQLLPEAGQGEAVSQAPQVWARGRGARPSDLAARGAGQARPRLGAPAAQCPGRRPRRASSPEPGASCGPLGAADSGAGADAGAARESQQPSQFPCSFAAQFGEPRTLGPLGQLSSRFLGTWAPEQECSRSPAAYPAASR